ncbi:MAG: peptide chain release factor N(5)-glutamine methyltransferase [Pelagibacteraceae bacterium]
MATVLETLNKSYQDLLSHNISTAKLDSEVILASVLKTNRINLITKQNLNLNTMQQNLYTSLIARRKKNEPVAYILNTKDFWNESYYVDKRVLIPRPETEVLIEMLLRKIKNKDKTFHILDIGCGSGCLLISSLKELGKSFGLGVDISSSALQVAKINIQKHNLDNRAKLLKANLFTIKIRKKFNIIFSNPPYLARSEYANLSSDIKKYEPKKALIGGATGIEFYKTIIDFSKKSLKENGFLALEIGDGQYNEIVKILTSHSFREIDKLKLVNGEIRCILATKV